MSGAGRGVGAQADDVPARAARRAGPGSNISPRAWWAMIAPWNFPVNLVMGPLAGVLAAGNRAMVKTSEFTPAVAALFEELSAAIFRCWRNWRSSAAGPRWARRSPNCRSITCCSPARPGSAKHILHAAADNLTPVTLELGGKSPVVVGRSADIAQATERVAMGKMMQRRPDLPGARLYAGARGEGGGGGRRG